MIEKVTMWRAGGQLFNSEAEALAYQRKQELITKITEFLYDRGDITHGDAEEVARTIGENLGWFRTVMDAAAKQD